MFTSAIWNISATKFRHSLSLGLAIAAISLSTAMLGGCAALTNPVQDGIPIRRLPDELRAEPKEGEETIPLAFLRQKPPKEYLLAPGDILGVWIEGVLGDPEAPPPVQILEQEKLPPALGFPIPVREDGTISLPLVEPILVKGLGVGQAEKRIVDAYTKDRKILQEGSERIIVTLMRPRRYHVSVVRQDTAGVGSGINTGGQNGGFGVGFRGGLAGGIGNQGSGLFGSGKRGSGFDLNLPAYENDVLNALTRSGGLPGLDAANEVIIQRGYPGSGSDPTTLEYIRIPLRMRPGEPIPFNPEDIILENGDIVFIEARDTDVFYTGGLLPPGQFVLPRDFDLDIIEAVSLIGGPLVNGGFSTGGFGGSVTGGGIGSPTPSLLTVIRQTVDGGQVVIRLDLNDALRDRRDRILVQPGDTLILQETKMQAITRYFSDVFNFSAFFRIFERGDATGSASLSLP